MLQLGQSAGGPNANHGTAGIEPAIERLDVRGGLRFAERHVDSGKNAARKRQQMRGENNLRLAQTRMLENFRSVTMGEEIVSLEIFIHLDEVEIAARIFSSATGAGL